MDEKTGELVFRQEPWDTLWKKLETRKREWRSMNRKALFFDIDGTLLTDGTKELPESARRALLKAQHAGHLIFINSGRARCLMQEVEAQVPADGYLCGCGTYIEIGGKTVFHHLISAKRRMELQRGIIACGLDGILEGTSGCTIQKADA